MNWAAVLEGFVYYGMLLGLPSVSVIVYFVLLSHHHTRLQERYTELKRLADHRRQRELSAREQERLRAPLFRFHRRAMAAPGAAPSTPAPGAELVPPRALSLVPHVSLSGRSKDSL